MTKRKAKGLSMNALSNLRRAELRRLLLHRRAASWIEVHNKVEDILKERIWWTTTALGERMQLTFEERRQLGIRTIACVDVNKKMVREYNLRRKRERDRRYAHRMRAQNPKARLSRRAKQLAAFLNSNWKSSVCLVAILRKRKGRPSRQDAAGKALRRAARELSEAEIGFEVKTEPGPRGGYLTFVRRSSATTDISENHSGRSADGIRAARCGDSNLSIGQCPPDKNVSPHRRSGAKSGTSRPSTVH
jgi:hypothetical protein